MAFVPNTADPIPIVLHHTPSDTASPSLLYPGEAAVCHGPTHTKMWIGDGTTNRLFLSTNPADSPLLNQSVLGGPFLPLSGGTLASPGNLTLDGGTLTVSGATPTVIWDVTGANPAQWALQFEATNLYWGMNESGRWPFYISRSPSPPFPLAWHFNCPVNTNQPVDIVNTLSVHHGVSVGGSIGIIGGIDAGESITFGHYSALGTAPQLRIVQSDPVIATDHELAGIWATGIPGVNDTPAGMFDPPVAGAGIRFFSRQGWTRNVTVGGDPLMVISRAEQLGAGIFFYVSANGAPNVNLAMTLEQDGALRLSSANPSVTWDKTSTDPRQWELRTGDEIDETFWGLHDDDGWRFWVNRTLGPPVSYIFYINDPTTLASWLRVNGYISCAGGITADSRIVSQGGEFLSDWSSDNPVSAPVFATQRMRDTGNIETGDVIGAVEFHSREQGGGTRRGAMIQAVATENHTVNVVGTELQFFTAANGSGGSGTPMMTLGQDANLTVVGTVTASGTLLTSDPALKEISPAPRGALAKVRELPVIDFRWKHGRDSKLHRGFSATDVARVMGEDSGCSAEGAYSLADMNAYLWRAVQELSANVQELEQRIH